APLRHPAFRLASGAILFAVLAGGVLEGVLPLRLAARLDQREIAALLVATALAMAVASVAAASARPRAVLPLAVVRWAGGPARAGATASVPAWLAALPLAGAGIGLGGTASLGMLLEAGPTERLVMAMVVWSQLSIVGYLLGPLLGGAGAAR